MDVGCNPQNVRLRSANRNNSYNTWNVNTSGNVNNNNANNANRCAPFVPIKDVRLSHRDSFLIDRTKSRSPVARRTIP